MPIYLCRWPNGDFSIVDAPSRESAIEILDEVANAEGCQMFFVEQFMAHFGLTEDGGFGFEGFGEATEDQIWERYPILQKAFDKILDSDPSCERHGPAKPEQDAAIRKAVQEERERVKPRKGKQPQTLLGQRIKQQMDAPTSMIDREIKKAAKKRLDQVKPKGKPH